MNMPARKLDLISYILQLKDERFLKEIEEFILEENPDASDPEFVSTSRGDMIKDNPDSEELD